MKVTIHTYFMFHIVYLINIKFFFYLNYKPGSVMFKKKKKKKLKNLKKIFLFFGFCQNEMIIMQLLMA